MTNDTPLESSYSLLLVCKRLQFQKWNFLCKIQYVKFCKQSFQKMKKIYISWKPLTMPFQICKDFCKTLNNLIFNQEKLKICKFSLTGCLQKNFNFFAKRVQFVSLFQRLSEKLNFIKIWQGEVGQNKDLIGYRKKQSFRQCAWGLRQLVLKPGFRPKGSALGV